MARVEATSIIGEVRRLVSESKLLLRKALEAVERNDIELAEKLAEKAIEKLDKASKILTKVESRVVKGGGNGR